MIVQFGPYPPPYGGISTYVKRMKLYLNSKSIKNEVWSPTYKKDIEGLKQVRLRYLPLYIMANKNIKIIHFNITGINSKVYIGICNRIFNRKRKKLLTIHGDVKDLFLNNKFLIKSALNSFDAIICVKKGDKEYLRAMGAIKAIYEIPAYITPIEDENDFANIPQNIWDFINNSKFLISANGWIRFYENEDLYGIDMLIELIRKIKYEGYDVSLLIAILGIDMQIGHERLYYDELKSKIINYNLQNNIMIFEVKDTEFYPILKKSKLFLRPTNTDGYGVSIAEALYYKVPSIASDVCSRPEGTIIFKSRDIDNLYIKTVDVIENYDIYKEKIKNIKQPNNGEKVLDIYKELNSQK